MSSTKSYAEFCLGLYAALLKDCAVHYPALAREFDRDFARLSSAVDAHGVRFFLDTMPAWRKHFDKCLSSGRLTRSNLLHFSCWKKEGTVPRLFRGLVLRVFDLNGDLKPDPDIQAIRMIRQLLGVVRKLKVDCGPRARSDAVSEFIETDLSVREGDLNWNASHGFFAEDASALSFMELVGEDWRRSESSDAPPQGSRLSYEHALKIQQVADYISASLGTFNPEDVRFRHGPGAVSDQSFGVYKYDFKNWSDRLESVFPAVEFACANYMAWLDSPLYKSPEVESNIELPAKLGAVAKTIKTPRLIASEPTSSQWCQQAIRDFLYTRVASSDVGHFVDFRRQELNGRLALEASYVGSHATIDLSSASDRVSCWHVERLFRRSPDLLEAMWATRSQWIEQRISRNSPELYKLRKFSTMGNATTFPVQSLFFLAIALGTLLYVRNQKVSCRLIRSLGKAEVRVFGDDIIVPEDCAGAMVEALQAFNLKVNVDKTFLNGKFRESCGVDAYGGQDVTTVSVLDLPLRAKPGSIVSSVDVHNNFVTTGWYETAAYIRKTVGRQGIQTIPVVAVGSGSFGWYRTYDVEEPRLKLRMHPCLQVLQAYCYRVKPKDKRAPAEGGAALLQFFTEASRKVTSAKSALGYLLQRAKVTLDRGWVDVR